MNDNAPLCECGCGMRVSRHRDTKQWNRYVWHHQPHPVKIPDIVPSPEDAPLCACGCGERVTWRGKYRGWNKFCRGHSLTSPKQIMPDPKNAPLCACGCGEPVTLIKRAGKHWNTYVRFHSSRGNKNSVGKIPWNKGMKVGTVPPNAFPKGNVPWNKGTKGVMTAWNKGKKASPELCKKLSEAHIGQPSWNKGMKDMISEETRHKMRIAKLGNRPWNIKDEKTSYTWLWNDRLRKHIRSRDENICQLCGKTKEENGMNLTVHHLNELGFDCSHQNLISVCSSCHGHLSAPKIQRAWQVYFEGMYYLHEVVA